jgi:hypothetical protein
MLGGKSKLAGPERIGGARAVAVTSRVPIHVLASFAEWAMRVFSQRTMVCTEVSFKTNVPIASGESKFENWPFQTTFPGRSNR